MSRDPSSDPFLPQNNLFSVPVQVQFILNELNLSYFLIPDIIVKFLSLGVTRRRYLNIHEKSDCLRIQRKFFG